MSKQFDEASQILYEQTGLYIQEVISMIRGLEKKVEKVPKLEKKIEHQQQELNKLYSLDIIQNYSKYRRAEWATKVTTRWMTNLEMN